MRVRSRVIAAFAALTLLTTVAACTPTPSGGAPTSEGLEAFYEQELVFESCEATNVNLPGVALPGECTDVEVPIDYNAPDGDTAQVRAFRVAATGEKIGSVIFNPGGPGFSGINYLPLLTDVWNSTELSEKFDLVGFDPRGIGASTPAIDCFSDTEHDADAINGGQELTDPDSDLAAACAGSVGGEDNLAHFGSREVARDLDILRATLGDEKLTYAGISYGTRFGTVYAEMFPQNVRALLLDGAIDPSEDVLERQFGQFGALQEAFDRVAAYCIEQGDCPLGSDPDAATAAFHDIVRPLIDEPVETSDGRGLSYLQAIDGVVTGLYNSLGWPEVIAGLKELQTGRGDMLQAARDRYHERSADGAYSNFIESALVYTCNDENRIPADEYLEAIESRYDDAPVLDPGRAGVTGVAYPCEDWPAEPSLGTPYGEGIDGLDETSTLTVSATGDALTPHETGVNLADILGGSLLTIDGDAHGVIYFEEPTCLTPALVRYLVDTQVPEPGTSCALDIPGAS